VFHFFNTELAFLNLVCFVPEIACKVKHKTYLKSILTLPQNS